MCHVNMLEPYDARSSEAGTSTSTEVLSIALVSVLPSYSPQEDDLVMQDVLCSEKDCALF